MSTVTTPNSPSIAPARNRHAYAGPHALHDDATAALTLLGEKLSVSTSTCNTHSVIAITGFGDNLTTEATAVYLVAAIASCIANNLRIRKALFDEHNLTSDLARDVHSVIGPPNSNTHYITTQRNPWMWEAISHMFIHLARSRSEFHPPGQILAKTTIKHDVHDHGLDLVAIYEGPNDSLLGVTAGECKAYLQNPSRAITDASRTLHEVDENKRDTDIRAAVSHLSSSLTTEFRSRIAGAFWREERTYLPFVFCEQNYAIQWTCTHEALRRLAVPIRRKYLYPLSLAHAHHKFDRICDNMRSYVRS